MNKHYFVFVAILFFSYVQAQAPNIVWEKVLGGTSLDMGTAITPTSDGGYAFVAFTDSANGDVTLNHGETDLWVVKLNATGEIEWQKSYGGNHDEYGRRISQTDDGGYIIIATSLSDDGDIMQPYGQTDYWILKLDSSGALDWQKSYGGTSVDNAYDLKQTQDGGYIIVGDSITQFNSFATNYIGSSDVWIVKLDASGNIQWENSFGGESDEMGMAVTQTFDGGYVIAAVTWSNIGAEGGNNDNNFYVVKLSPSGSFEWQNVIGGSGNEWVFDVVQLYDGSYIIAGNTISTDAGILNHGAQDGFVVKLNSSGELDWHKAFGGTEYDGFNDVEKTLDGKIILTGYTNSYNGDVTDYHGGQDAWVVAINAAGDLIWQKAYGSTNNEGIGELRQTADGGFIMVGSKLPLFGNSSTNNCWVVRLSAEALSTDTFENNSITIFPNPVKENLSILTNPNLVIESVSIYNMLGQLILVNINPGEVVDVTSLQTGNYFVKTVTEKGTTIVKFIKE
ncbi:MAG: secretion protein [Flavobacterium sp.]|uniref:T9SS type A sorting domain-containing protein n=1 Tax=Flavobacterium sp. TaxID=239 RepID=UPI0025C46290|nr:T9SS type A sorting domain-containing protein [Flavobacterium sp.]MBA4133840.1 secretion protein [Flavobacterium sp.]